MVESPAVALERVGGRPVPELWFDRLDVEAARCYVPEPSLPKGGDDVLEGLAVALERVTVVPLSVFLLVASPRVLARGLLDPGGLKGDWAFYAAPDWLGAPESFFPAPHAAPDPEIRPVERTLGAPVGAEVVDISFPSTFVPVNPALRDEYLADVRNQVVHARWWRHPGDPRPTIICVHGFQAAAHALNAALFDVPWLFRAGLDVLQFQLPYHGARASAVEGWNFLSLDVGRMAEAVAHSVWDLRSVLDYVFDAGAPAAGLTGVSLGGYLTSLLAGLDDRLAFAVPMAPVASLGDLVHDLAPLAPVLPAMLGRIGWGLDDVRRHMAVHTPLQHDPKLAPERLLVVGAVADRLTHPYHQRLLETHWGHPDVFWHAGAHQLHLHRKEYRHRLGRFLDRVGVLP